jgi:hypothetical protein
MAAWGYGAIVRRLDFMDDDTILRLHRELSRRATLIRQRQPSYQQNYTTGMAASRSRRQRDDV